MRSVTDLKQKKLLDILKAVQIHGPITKPDVAVMTNISTVTAHTIITELEHAGLLVSAGELKPTGGRKAILYKTNPEFGYIIGQYHGRTKITTNLYDLSLSTLYVNKISSDLSKSSTAIGNIKEEIDKSIQESGISKDKILGIGITLPGQINHRDGVINSMLGLGDWNNTLLQSIIERSIGIPACVYNDNRANIISCKWLNRIPASANAAYVTISDGVGVGVMLNGEVFSGNHSFAGELGHLDTGGKLKCHCGSVGCVETLVCSANIIRQVQGKYGLSVSKTDSTKLCVNEIIQMAKDGNNGVYEIIRKSVRHSGLIIDAIIKAYDPEKIIIYNPWLMHFNELYNELVDNVFGRCRWLKRGALDIEVDMDNVIDSYGPASIVLENLFNFNSEHRIALKM